MKFTIPLQDRNPLVRVLALLVFLILSVLMVVVGLAVLAVAFAVLVVLAIVVLTAEFLHAAIVRPGAYVLFKLLKLPRP